MHSHTVIRVVSCLSRPAKSGINTRLPEPDGPSRWCPISPIYHDHHRLHAVLFPTSYSYHEHQQRRPGIEVPTERKGEV
jgi:hypothetical protein